MATLYTPLEVAERLKIKKTTVYELIKRGELASTKIGKQLRVSEDALQHYLIKDSVPTEPESAILKREYLKSDAGLILCGQDSILDFLCSFIEAHPLGVSTLRSFSGSYNSLYSLYYEKIHVASTHLWNAVHNSYNLSFIDHLIPGTPVTCYHLLKRMQGFYVAKGNPKGIHTITDLTRSEVTFVNREKGSGSRILLDQLLMKHQIASSRITGYSVEVLSHLAGASYIISGRADVCLGQEAILRNFPTLDFIPIQEESLDLVFLKKNEHLPGVQALAEVLHSEEFKQVLLQQGDLNVQELGKRLL